MTHRPIRLACALTASNTTAGLRIVASFGKRNTVKPAAVAFAITR